jgi:hypothetical protein
VEKVGIQASLLGRLCRTKLELERMKESVESVHSDDVGVKKRIHRAEESQGREAGLHESRLFCHQLEAFLIMN